MYIWENGVKVLIKVKIGGIHPILILNNLKNNVLWVAYVKSNRATKENFIFTYYVFIFIVNTSPIITYIVYNTYNSFLNIFGYEILCRRGRKRYLCRLKTKNRWPKSFVKAAANNDGNLTRMFTKTQWLFHLICEGNNQSNLFSYYEEIIK